MRITTVFRRLLGVIAMCVDDVGRKGEALVLDVTPRWRRPRCTRRMEELVARLVRKRSSRKRSRVGTTAPIACSTRTVELVEQCQSALRVTARRANLEAHPGVVVG